MICGGHSWSFSFKLLSRDSNGTFLWGLKASMKWARTCSSVVFKECSLMSQRKLSIFEVVFSNWLLGAVLTFGGNALTKVDVEAAADGTVVTGGIVVTVGVVVVDGFGEIGSEGVDAAAFIVVTARGNTDGTVATAATVVTEGLFVTVGADTEGTAATEGTFVFVVSIVADGVDVDTAIVVTEGPSALLLSLLQLELMLILPSLSLKEQVCMLL